MYTNVRFPTIQISLIENKQTTQSTIGVTSGCLATSHLIKIFALSKPSLRHATSRVSGLRRGNVSNTFVYNVTWMEMYCYLVGGLFLGLRRVSEVICVIKYGMALGILYFVFNKTKLFF